MLWFEGCLITRSCGRVSIEETFVMAQRFNIGDQVTTKRGHTMTVFAVHAGLVSVFWKTKDGKLRERALPQRSLHHVNGEDELPMDHEIALAHHGLG
jgi:hypothetical protein